MAEDQEVEKPEAGDQIVPDGAETDEKDSASDEPANDHKSDAQHTQKTSKFAKLKQKYLSNKKLSIPLTILAFIALLLIIPFTRYAILGTFMSRNYTAVVNDTETGKPVSSANVTIAGVTAKTDSAGKTTLKLKVGNKSVKISKKYYQDMSATTLVPITGSDVHVFKITATGRQVPVVVKNRITGQPVANANVAAAGTEAKTDKDGKVTIVLPVDKKKFDATLSADHYNDTKASIVVTDKEIDANIFNITPAGKLYFLSKLSGKIDVVKTDLDGANRQTVLAGTGNENDTGTVLLATRDWKFLALDSIRTADGNDEINLIDTSNDQLTNIDKGNATFTLTGWSGHNFVYKVDRNAVQSWQAKKQALKSFDADSKKLTTIDETQASGDQNVYASEDISWVSEVEGKVVYFKTWTTFDRASSIFSPVDLTGKQAVLISVDDNGTKTTVKSFDLNWPNLGYYRPLTSYSAVQYEPNEIFFDLYSESGTTSYNKYSDGKVTEHDKNAEEYFTSNKPAPTYLVSPSGKKTLWSESRDGKNLIFVGNADGAATTAESTGFGADSYNTYGWFTDNYALLSKNGSELYIVGVPMAQTLPKVGVQILKPLKITDYHKPAFNFYGYGGGYGGL